MNERINELAIQSGGIWRGGYVEQANGDSVYTDKKFVSGGDMDVEQFAELIVWECLVPLWSIECMQSDLALEEYNRNAAKIKQHFGVEE